MAARRAASVGASVIATFLKQGVYTLSDDRRKTGQRNQSWQATVLRSLNRLTQAERLVLDQIARNHPTSSNFTFSDALLATQSTGLSRSVVLDALQGLIEKSLLQAEGYSEPPSFRLIRSIRAILSNAFDSAKTQSGKQP
jgi:predicted ATPase